MSTTSTNADAPVDAAGGGSRDEPIAIVVTGRDRVSTLPRTIDALLATTPDSDPVIVVLGGVPKGFRKRITASEWPSRVEFHFEDAPLNPQEGRNIGLRLATTRLCATVDTDVVPRGDWLETLYRCEQDTGAAAVVPLILERETQIHCAGTDLYIDRSNGVAFGYKTLRHEGMPYTDGCNLTRSECDYAELHAQLVDREASLELDAFDEAIPEGGEVDQGLTLKAAGKSVWFEPSAVVLFDRFAALDADDIPQFEAKWDSDKIIDGLRHFNDKWGIDISERGGFINFLADTNAYLGKLPRRMHADWAISASRQVRRVLTVVTSRPSTIQRKLRRRRFGANDWSGWVREVESTPQRHRTDVDVLLPTDRREPALGTNRPGTR